MAEEKIINLTDRITVYATGKHTYAKHEGEEMKMHPELASYLEKKGWVTRTADGSTSKSKQK